MIVNEKPWECPRCRTWHSPVSLKCDCKPIKRNYCSECLSDAYSIFNTPFPNLDVIELWAESFHKNYDHRNKSDNQ